VAGASEARVTEAKRRCGRAETEVSHQVGVVLKVSGSRLRVIGSHRMQNTKCQLL
jgi:hypothetical protein